MKDPLTLATILVERQVAYARAKRAAVSIAERMEVDKGPEFKEATALVNALGEVPAKASQTLWHLSKMVADRADG